MRIIDPAIVDGIHTRNRDAFNAYAERMASVEDCLDDFDPSGISDGRAPGCWWRPLNLWFGALDSLHAAAGETGDNVLDAFIAYEAGRYMAKRLDVVEAIAMYYSPRFDNGANWDSGYYSDPQSWIDGRGSKSVCFSNGIVNYDDAAGRLFSATSTATNSSDVA